MRNEKRKVRSRIQYVRPGIVLLVTLVLLVVLSVLMFTLSIRMSAQRHRDKYIINYQAARYARDSAVKYALATLNDMNTPMLIERPNEPDFSDLFMLDEEQYRELVAEWAALNEEILSTESERNLEGEFSSPNSADSVPNDVKGFNDINGTNYVSSFDDAPNSLTVPGPYGP
ncbi:MAG: hypothetical protein ACYTDW_18175, partial [Planctomycetota bacterium]